MWSCHHATGCFFCIFGWYFYIEIRLKSEKKILLSSSRAYSLSPPTFLLSTPVENSEATLKKATKCNKESVAYVVVNFAFVNFDLSLCVLFFFSIYKVSNLPESLKKTNGIWERRKKKVQNVGVHVQWPKNNLNISENAG